MACSYSKVQGLKFKVFKYLARKSSESKSYYFNPFCHLPFAFIFHSSAYLNSIHTNDAGETHERQSHNACNDHSDPWALEPFWDT